MQSDLAPLGSAVGYQQQVANLGQFQHRPANARLVQQRGGIEQSVKIEVPPARRYPRSSFRQLLLPFDPLAVLRRRKLHHALPPQRRGGVMRKQLAKLVEFQHAFAASDGLGWEGSSGSLYGTAANCRDQASRSSMRRPLRRGRTEG